MSFVFMPELGAHLAKGPLPKPSTSLGAPVPYWLMLVLLLSLSFFSPPPFPRALSDSLLSCSDLLACGPCALFFFALLI